MLNKTVMRLKEKVHKWNMKRKRKVFEQTRKIPVYLGNNKAITKIINGHKMFVDTRDLSVAPHILLDGIWEENTTKVLLDIIKRGFTVVDIGANAGYYSILLAGRVGLTGKLYTFEANPAMVEIIHANMAINGFLDYTTVINKAVYSETTTLEFNVHEKHCGNSSLFERKDHIINLKDSIKKISIEAVSLDDFFPTGTQIDFLKIDAEGAEPHIFKGAKRLLSENPNVQIILEYSPELLNGLGFSAQEFYDEICQLGFSIFRITQGSNLIKSYFEDLPPIYPCDVLLKRL